MKKTSIFYSLLYYVNPQFKDRFFNGPEQYQKTKEMLLEELEKVNVNEGAVIEVQDSGEKADTLTKPASKCVDRETAELWKKLQKNQDHR